MMSFISDIILVLHFGIVIFITLGLFLIPIGWKLNWNWIANRKLRLLHCGMMAFVTLETFMGITCPLTAIENSIRGLNQSNSFVSYWVMKIIYWDLSTIFFLVLYSLSLGWALFLWKICPPRKS
jgi:hypothetical protein